jgi:hypothetical protein
VSHDNSSQVESVQRRRTTGPHRQETPREKRETCRDYRETPREYAGGTGSAYQALLSGSQDGCPACSAGFEPSLGMEIASTTPVAAPPPGPGQDQPGTAGSRPDQAPQHMAHFRHRQGKQGAGGGCGTVSCRGSLGKRLDTDARQKDLRQHHQRDVAIPAKARCAPRSGPGPDLWRFRNLPRCGSRAPMACTIC